VQNGNYLLDVLFFAGSRWVLTSASALREESVPNQTVLVDLFANSSFWHKNMVAGGNSFFLSEAVEAVDQAIGKGIQLGLRWYRSLQTIGSFKFGADESRPVEASLQCEECNNSTNKCQYGGLCLADGSCDCTASGAFGTLCVNRPLSNGVCDTYFNTPQYDYDGGDCCAATCVNNENRKACGNRMIDFAFGQNLSITGNGFPNCADQSMMPVSIYLNSTTYPEFKKDQSGYKTYNILVDCLDGRMVPLRVGLNPVKDGPSKQMIYLSDEETSCSLTFTNILPYSGLNISFQVFDETMSVDNTNPGPSILMRKESGVVEDFAFELPTVYSSCLKAILASVMDLNLLYTDSYQDKAVKFLNEEVAARKGECKSEQYTIERYAVLAVYFAEIPEPDAVPWVDTVKHHCSWVRVVCGESNSVLQLNHGKQ